MKRLSLILSLIITLSLLCSCSNIKKKLSPPVENAGEVVTAAPRTDTEEPESTDTESVGSEESDTEEEVEDEKPLGSAGTLDGRTVVLSVFASDAANTWGDGAESAQLKLQTLEYLTAACEWISAKAFEYDVKSELIYDWQLHRDLTRNVNFSSFNMLADDMALYEEISKSTSGNVDSAALLEKYDAEDIIYIFFINTPLTNETNPIGMTHIFSPDIGLEYLVFPLRVNGDFTSSAVLAREILHFFGAYDLSEAEGSPIPAQYTAHLAETGSDDIMFFAGNGKEITASFSPVDAYYVGLIDSCPELEEWSLPQAERFIYNND